MSESIPERTANSTQLVHELGLIQDAEYFANPQTRLDFVASLNPDEFVGLAQHVNARMRGFEPRERVTAHEEGGYLPMLGTPEAAEKQAALRAGFGAIQEYIASSPDSVAQKTRSAGMAAEALIIWVHPFNDANGRTSRFFGKFIEDGVSSNALIAETTDKNERQRMYFSSLRIDQANTTRGLDLLLDDDEIEAIKATEMPVAEGISRSLKMLMEDKSRQQKVLEKAAAYKAKRASYLARKAVAESSQEKQAV